ncbi:hypothetical protein [Endozoicomonas sp. SCSIO W0465]|uniref:hypothetical protein n=1 Tax=Endozoicomonas sp. SCSIO W0465 TaxID=2918516 RepID=UPI0020751687|nr:hypothetical protein [Endozoicomonas sp. SCSIO W0465]USE39211.1 hypothetical protein MJO57_14260 [Endozoicomonas sp. SCSIO W0465]
MNQLDLLTTGQPLINDNDLTKKPVLTLTTSNEIIYRFYGQSFLNGWLKVKEKRHFKQVIKH